MCNQLEVFCLRFFGTLLFACGGQGEYPLFFIDWIKWRIGLAKQNR